MAVVDTLFVDGTLQLEWDLRAEKLFSVDGYRISELLVAIYAVEAFEAWCNDAVPNVAYSPVLFQAVGNATVARNDIFRCGS